MVEILGCDLKRFFDTVDNPPKDAEITYAGNSSGINYEVWEVSDELFKVCLLYTSLCRLLIVLQLYHPLY